MGPPWFHFRSMAPTLSLCECVFLLIVLHIHLHIVPNVIPRSIYVWPRESLHLLKKGEDQPIVLFTYLCHMIGEESVFSCILHINLFELGVKVDFYDGSSWFAQTHMLGQLLWEHRWYSGVADSQWGKHLLRIFGPNLFVNWNRTKRGFIIAVFFLRRQRNSENLTSVALEKAFPGFLGDFFGCWTLSKKEMFKYTIIHSLLVNWCRLCVE